ncbi:DDB1- and CUL4-associated factor 10-like [Babylonia areolata]|uniref:DDB1- and CUL4-associated factor 10-like n=1 Tax=Babylonia areolata TaxID=304850 RepID=UPI003FD3E219
MYRNNLAWLRGRETGVSPSVGSRDRLSNMLYSSVSVVDFWDPSMSCQENHRGIFNFDFSTDGAVLVAACEGKSFLVFDPNNRKLLKARRRAHTDCVNCVRFLDTRSFVTCSDDTTVALWDLRYLKNKVRVFAGHTSWVKNIEYASSLGLLITSGFDGAVYSWNINNYSKDEECKRLFHTEGLMRCKLTPDESKLVLSTSRGYLMVVHDLDLLQLNVNMDNYKADLTSGSRFRATIANFYALFKRTKNRLEIINEFPEGNDAENIASLQVHPQGWCIVSRNTNKEDVAEWTCVHDIHTQPSLVKEEEGEEQMTTHLPSNSSVRIGPPSNSSARTNPPRVRWGPPLLRTHRPYLGSLHPALPQRANGQEHAAVVFRSLPGVSAGMSSQDEDELDTDSDSSDSDTSSVDLTGCGSNECGACSRGETTVSQGLYKYFLGAQWNDPGPSRIRVRHRAGSSDVDMPDNPVDPDQQQNEDWHAHNQVQRSTRLRLPGRQRLATFRHEHHVRHSYRNRVVPAFKRSYLSQPRLIYCQQEPNVGRGFIKEQCFSSDGRLIVSPCGNGVRLLAFDNQCRELCDCDPVVARQPRPLHEMRELRSHPHVVLTTRFSPTHSLFVSGSLDGSVAFMTPSP